MSPSRLFRSLLLALAAVLAVGGLTALPASAAGTAKISGTVTGPDGPVDWAEVSLYKREGTGSNAWWDQQSSVDVNPNGTFTLSKLDPGSYRIKFSSPGSGLQPQYWNHKSSFAQSDIITLTKGQSRTGVNASLEAGGSISGVVTDSDGGPVEDAFVFAVAEPDPGTSWEIASDETEFFTQTQPHTEDEGFPEAGSYTIDGLPAGTYRVCVDDDYVNWEDPQYLQTCWGGVEDVELASDVTLAARQERTGVDIEAHRPASVSGTVTGPDGPVAEGVADLQEYDEEADAWYSSYIGDGGEIEDGEYSIRGIPSGEYRLCFDDYTDGSSAAPECFDDVETVDEAEDVVLEPGDDRVIDAALEAGGTITGKILDSKGKPIKTEVYAFVYRQRADGEWSEYRGSQAASTKTGAYTVRGLAPGATYRVGFHAMSSAYADEYYNDKGSVEEAEDVVIATASTTVTRNAQLGSGASIAGTVKSPAGTSVSDGWVRVHRKVGSEFREYDGTDISSKGSYTLGGLPAGTYRVEFVGPEDESFAGEFWNDRDTLAKAEDVVVKTGQKVTKIDATLTATGPGGAAIKPATPTLSSTKPVVGTAISAKPGTWNPSRTTFTYTWEVWDGETLARTAEGSTFTPTAADQGKRISVKTTGSVPGFDSVTSASSAKSSPVGQGTLKSATPKITGTAKVGSVLTAVPGAWTPGTQFTYVWKVNKSVVAGATSSTFTPGDTAYGKTVTVDVIGTLDGYKSPVKKTSSATKKVAAGTLLDLRIAIQGSPNVGGSVLVGPAEGHETPDPSTGAEPTSYTVQWFVSSKSASAVQKVGPGQTPNPFMIPASALGKPLTVKMVGSRTGHTSRTYTSSAVTVLPPANN